MEVYALIGHSGTGKSHHAPVIAKQYGIEYIIDDGLLIKGNKILAGRSAKRENTRFGAIRIAIFKDPEYAEQVKKKLSEIKPGRILILSTSRRMADLIAENLELAAPAYYYTIEDISDPESIQTALALRATENRHVIPIPTFAIKKEFPGYLIDPLRSFFSLPTSQPVGSPVERSVVRPVFSTLGSFYIAEHVITDLVEHMILNIPGVYRVLDIALENGGSKVYLNIDLTIDLKTVPDMKIDVMLRDVQQTVKEQIEYLTGFYLDQVNVSAKKVFFGEEPAAEKKTGRK
jgi:uncharacterized alkaline shock family protein YloU/adenylate kinase family enzyme